MLQQSFSGSVIGINLNVLSSKSKGWLNFLIETIARKSSSKDSLKSVSIKILNTK